MGRFHAHEGHEHSAHEHAAPGHAEHADAAHGHAAHGHAAHGHAAHEHPPAPAGDDADHARAGLGDHTAYATGRRRVEVLADILGENDAAAAANRAALDAAGVICVNVMSSPGAGKTAILARTLAHLAERGRRAGVVVGDIETSLDADRLGGVGAQVALVNTSAGFGGECHLDAPMVAAGLARLDLSSLDVVLVENVGNLVCPAEFDVGAHRRVMVSAITEGEEKPLKYPVMFRAVELVLVNKLDLLPHLEVDVELFERNVHAVNPTADCLRVSARTGAGLDAWFDWLDRVEAERA